MSLRSAAGAAARAAPRRLQSASNASASLVTRRMASGGGGYNQPSGRLFNEPPVPKGQKREKEAWESLWNYGMFGGMAFATVLLLYKPDTSLQTWAMGEAKKRLEEGDKTWQYKPSPNSGYPNGV